MCDGSAKREEKLYKSENSPRIFTVNAQSHANSGWVFT